MQQTKQAARRCTGGAAARHSAVARQASAATKQNASVTAPGAGSVPESQPVGAVPRALAHHPPSLACRLVVSPPSWSIRPGRLRAVRSTTGR